MIAKYRVALAFTLRRLPLTGERRAIAFGRPPCETRASWALGTFAPAPDLRVPPSGGTSLTRLHPARRSGPGWRVHINCVLARLAASYPAAQAPSRPVRRRQRPQLPDTVVAAG